MVLNEKRLVKREGISFPDFIAEMVVKDEFLMESNTNMKKVDMLIEEFDKNTPQKTYIQKKRK